MLQGYIIAIEVVLVKPLLLHKAHASSECNTLAGATPTKFRGLPHSDMFHRQVILDFFGLLGYSHPTNSGKPYFGLLANECKLYPFKWWYYCYMLLLSPTFPFGMAQLGTQVSRYAAESLYSPKAPRFVTSVSRTHSSAFNSLISWSNPGPWMVRVSGNNVKLETFWNHANQISFNDYVHCTRSLYHLLFLQSRDMLEHRRINYILFRIWSISSQDSSSCPNRAGPILIQCVCHEALSQQPAWRCNLACQQNILPFLPLQTHPWIPVQRKISAYLQARNFGGPRYVFRHRCVSNLQMIAWGHSKAPAETEVMKKKALLNHLESAAIVNAWARCSYTAVALHCHEAKIWPVVDEIPNGSEWAGRGQCRKAGETAISRMGGIGEVFCGRLLPNLILSIYFQWTN